MLKQYKKDKLTILLAGDRRQLGENAATMAAEKIVALLQEKNYVNIIFAAAPSQNEFLQTLAADTSLPWQRVNAFHMDEYCGLPADAPQSFGHFLRAALFDRVPLRSVHFLDGNAADIARETQRYAALLREYPPDLVFMGIGENTHLAFNDPPVADFHDPQLVKRVELDAVCRQQQVNDGCFSALSAVPSFAVTLTIPALLQASFIYCMVPGARKARAVASTLGAVVSETYPSTILRTHDHAVLFTDPDSFRLAQHLVS